MVNLIWQAFYLQWKSALLFLIVLIGAFFLFYFIWGEDIIFLLAIFWALNLSFRSAQLEGEKGGLLFLAILPLGREHIVISKFFVSFLATLLAFIMGALGSFLLYGPEIPGDQFFFMAQMFTLILLLKGVFWIFFFRDGYKKARDNIRLVFLVPLFFWIFYEVPLEQFGPQVLGISIAFYFLLILPSIRFFNMRELLQVEER